jgi:hypothetical protein
MSTGGNVAAERERIGIQAFKAQRSGGCSRSSSIVIVLVVDLIWPVKKRL